MKRLKPFFVLVVLTLAFTLGLGDSASALTLDADGNYQLGGYIQNMTGLRLSDGVNEKEDLSMFRSELFFDFNARFSDAIQLKVIGRGHYEGVYGLDSDVNQNPDGESIVPGPDKQDMVSDFDFREYYMTYNVRNWVIKFGRQQVAWGEADAIRISDIINPLDLSWRWSFPTWEDIRIPLHMLNVSYSVPNSAYDLRFELVWVPADFRPLQFAPKGANWSLWDNLFAFNNTLNLGIFHDEYFATQERDLPDRDMGNGQGGLRIRANIAGFDATFFVYNQRDQAGVHTGFPVTLGGGPTPFKFHFPYITTIGGTFNVYSEMLETVFRCEYGYIFDQPFSGHFGSNDGTSVPFNFLGRFDYEESDVFHYMIGFDYQKMIPFLNRTKGFWFSGQFYQKYILDIDEKEFYTWAGDDDSEDSQTIVSLLINTEYYEGKIVPQVLGVSFITEESGFFDANITYKPTFTLTFQLGYLNIWGNTNRAGLYFGPIKDNDEIYGKVKWSF